jgi:CheY-like chemotaxis protein
VKEEQAAKEEAQKALDRAQRMEIVGRMASGLSHDFNNTLTVIRGTAEIIQFDPAAEDVGDLAGNIIRSSDNAADLSRRLLIFSRQGDTRDVRGVDLGETLQRLGKSLRRLLPANVEVSVVAEASLPAAADPSQLDQAILNLSLNARDAMPRGGWLELKAEDREMPDGSPGVLLQVRDSGVGMDEETVALATEPFFTTKEEGRGTGLGLAMVKKMVELHGGILTIDSSPGLGSSFKVHLPAWDEEEMDVTQVAGDLVKGSRILVVDDDSAVRRVLEQALEVDGHRVVAMSSPGEASAIFQGGYCFDLLITDGVPQRENTPPLIEQFLESCPHGRVLVYSGYSEEYLAGRGLQSDGRIQVATKPLPSGVLRQRISALLSEVPS